MADINIEPKTGLLKSDMFLHNWPLYVLASIIVIGFFALMIILMKYTVPAGSRDVAYMLFGSLAAAFGAVVNYFFGSSKGSADKTEILKNGVRNGE